MAQYESPGVYVEEVPSANRPIELVGSSTGAFVGFAQKGPIGEARLIGNRAVFFDTFGGFIPGATLAHAVNLFFQNGGTRCYVVRTCGHGVGGARLATTVPTVLLSGAAQALRVEASSPGAWARDIEIEISYTNPGVGPIAAPDFRLRVSYRGDEVENHFPVRLDPADPARFVDDVVNSASRYIRVRANPASLAPLPGRPAAGVTTLTAGVDGIAAASIRNSDFTGPDGLQAFDTVDDINIVGVADSSARGVMLDGIAYCENRGDCFFVAQAPETADNAQAALAFKQASGPDFVGQAPFNSSYGALYVPWLEVPDPITNKTILVPPLGAVAGRYSATDVRRGVHKAPAGIEDGLLRGVSRLARQFNRAEIEVLNPASVNVIRYADGVGRVIWGARTLSADPALRYVPTRRLLLSIEESIDQGTQWVVFEPNTPELWRSIERNVRAFLRVVWRTGALFGDTEQQGFRVKCDEETNPPDSIEAGLVVTEIGVAITKPAEFVIFRIAQSKAGATIEE